MFGQQVAQSCFATTFTDPGAQSTYLNLLPGCHLPFHWPRLDKDQLLCVRFLDVAGCHWSGGFTIRNISSFHINVRDAEGHSLFIRVEVVQQECTYCVVFSDASSFPPPFRVDNMAEVPILFHQSDVPDTYIHTTVNDSAFCRLKNFFKNSFRRIRSGRTAPFRTFGMSRPKLLA